MIVQACLNGARREDFHPAVPLTPQGVAKDGARCLVAGAAELHVHPRDPQGRESLAPETIGATVRALRASCPGTFIGVSTGEWIERDSDRTLDAIAGWRELPDYASVNLSEAAAPEIMARLGALGVRIEAGLASAADAERLLSLDDVGGVLRVLIEINEQDLREAMRVAEAIAELLARAPWRRPILLHGFDATVWPFVRMAAERRWSTRVGFEDGRDLPDGSRAPDNAALVGAAAAIMRAKPRAAPAPERSRSSRPQPRPLF